MTKLHPYLTIRRPSLSRHSLTACLLLIATVLVTPFMASAVAVGQLRCEYLKDPLGIDTPQPRLS